jgi:hypothetical protein
MEALVRAHAVDRHDVGMVQAGHRLGLALEAVELARVEQGVAGQDLEGDVPAEGDLLGLVDDAHTAAADLAEDAVIPQLLQLGRPRYHHRSGRRRDGLAVFLDLLHADQGREEVADIVRQLGVLGDVFRQGGPFPPAVPGGELVGQLVEQDLASGTALRHVRCPPARRAGRTGFA